MANTLLTIIILETAIFFLGIIVLIIKNWNNILCWLYPNWFMEVEILGKDNKSEALLKRKRDDAKGGYGFYHRGSWYLYNPKVAYLKGRVVFHLYNEDDPSPLDFRNVGSSDSGALMKEYEALQVADLFHKNKGEWIIYVVVGILAGIIVGYAIKSYSVGKELEALKTGSSAILGVLYRKWYSKDYK